MTDFSELLDAGRIQRGRFSREQAKNCLRLARRDIETAQAVLKISAEWAFNIAYNAMQQAGRAFLFHRGYRAVGEAQHATVVFFLGLGLGPENEEIVAVMDRMRRNRNRATYEQVGTITKNAATEGVSAARELMAEIVRRVGPPDR